MTFSNQNILIACSDKKDRLQCFNYFDHLNADAIYTATDINQMNQLLAQEGEQINVLIIEISKQWIQNINQIIDLKVKNPSTQLVGLVGPQISLSHQQFQDINSHIPNLLFSPVSEGEMVAKNLALSGESKKPIARSNQDDLDAFLVHYFQPSGLPLLLISVADHRIIHINETTKKTFAVEEKDIEQNAWYQLVNCKQISVEKLKENLKEKGQIEQVVQFEFGGRKKPVRLRINYISIGDESFYLAELHDLREQVYQQQFLKNLERVTTLEFENKDHLSQMKHMLMWARIDFCFIVKRDRTGSYSHIVWDCSLNNYAQKFIAGNHDFVIRKINAENILEMGDKAHEAIPGDDFLSFYTINTFMACHCYIDEAHDALLVTGSIKKHPNWSSMKLLFKQLSLHYKQSMAFKVLQQSHESESQYDALTDLMNRRYIVRSIEQAIADNLPFMAVMFLDLDRFKVINDSLGHDVGDDVLINIAQILKHHVNGYGVAARYAGDEFLILLNRDVDPEKTEKIANDILKAVASPIKLNNGSEINLTISLGIAYFPKHGSQVEKLIKQADVALYDAKLNGKNRYTVYNPDMSDDQAKQGEEMVKNLQAAIDNDQIDVYYQPKINASTEDIMGFEALVRWEHPELGIISPGLFIPLAEQSELIHQIGLLVIKKATRALQTWQEKYKIPLTMSVNLSPIQLSDKDLPEKINDIINTTGIYPKHLDFEITESEKFKSVKDALLMFKKLVGLGCTLSIDDFGTGHSTLDYLRKIPAKTLKIDQVFVKNIGLSPDDEAILDATIDMAKRVGHDIVAEGVETEEQRIYLSQKGCDYFQGYLYCRPVPAAEIDRILTQRAEILKNN